MRPVEKGRAGVLAFLLASQLHPAAAEPGPESPEVRLPSVAIGATYSTWRLSQAPVVVRNPSADTVRVRSPQLDSLRRVLTDAGLTTEAAHGSALLVRGAAIEVIGDLAARNAITLHELSAQRASLEEAYMKLTDEVTEYRAVSQ